MLSRNILTRHFASKVRERPAKGPLCGKKATVQPSMTNAVCIAPPMQSFGPVVRAVHKGVACGGKQHRRTNQTSGQCHDNDHILSDMPVLSVEQWT